jgi:hypothetical protein
MSNQMYVDRRSGALLSHFCQIVTMRPLTLHRLDCQSFSFSFLQPY